ncbi:nitroreductase family protein [Tautonia marina]|uniref:nitroreductase family protein n=1 Tax=Tautonia marina TaxID=2653855 RepID=UPI00126084C2|nr:nitroreductase family protein [Tautonia marina]
MTAAEAIQRRQSFVRFDPDRLVPDTVLARLLHLASRAHSPHHLQPWRFLVLRDRNNRNRLHRAAFHHPRLFEAPVAILVLGYHHPHQSHWEAIREQLAAAAPLSAEDLGRMNAEVRRDLAAEPDLGVWACRHAQAAATTLMIAAPELGLATAPIDRFDATLIGQTFGIPNDHTLCAVIALGYPIDDPPTPPCLPLAELCFQEHFGQPWTLGEGDDPAPPEGRSSSD